ncbi:RNA polymerase sigma factor [Halalkalibaculum sp. DA384]|uniref:RNA polymerase sigma factor n=1 Tax=Halalkalibaculum sp. DA384 TaxID=3373606 RepID=UPI003754B6D1
MFNWFKRRGKKEDSYQSNEDWINGLESPPDDNAIRALRKVLIRGLKPALSKYVDRELDQFVEDVAQDSLLKILDNIHTFRGESKFTTWAMKIAVREGLTELRRKRYDDISLDDLKHEDDDSEIRSMSVADNQPAPDRTTHESQLMEKMMTIINQELTEKQKIAIKAIVISGIPPSVVAEQLGTNRNALYKVVHDARLKLKHRFELEGIDPDEMLNKL